MTPKKVWGVIIIVLGILIFLSNVSSFNMSDSLLNDIQYYSSKYGNNKSFDSNHYLKEIEQKKTSSSIGMLLGIAMAIGGTLLLKVKKASIPKHPIDDFSKKDREDIL